MNFYLNVCKFMKNSTLFSVTGIWDIQTGIEFKWN